MVIGVLEICGNCFDKLHKKNPEPLIRDFFMWVNKDLFLYLLFIDIDIQLILPIKQRLIFS